MLLDEDLKAEAKEILLQAFARGEPWAVELSLKQVESGAGEGVLLFTLGLTGPGDFLHSTDIPSPRKIRRHGRVYGVDSMIRCGLGTMPVQQYSRSVSDAFSPGPVSIQASGP